MTIDPTEVNDVLTAAFGAFCEETDVLSEEWDQRLDDAAHAVAKILNGGQA